MMLDAEFWARNKGFSCLYVSCDYDVVGFYKKCGYIVDKDDDHPQFTRLKKEI